MINESSGCFKSEQETCYNFSMNDKDLTEWLRARLNMSLSIDEWQRPQLEALLLELMMSREDIHPICKH